MRYCPDCGDKKGWPNTFAIALGPCEICGKYTGCNDIHHSRLPTPKPKVKLSFAQIDARDNHLLGIEGSNGWVSRPRSEHNARLMFKVTRYYLEKLKDLQESIISEFGPLFEDESGIKPGDGFCSKECPCKSDTNNQLPCQIVGNDLDDLYYT